MFKVQKGRLFLEAGMGSGIRLARPQIKKAILNCDTDSAQCLNEVYIPQNTMATKLSDVVRSAFKSMTPKNTRRNSLSSVTSTSVTTDVTEEEITTSNTSLDSVIPGQFTDVMEHIANLKQQLLISQQREAELLLMIKSRENETLSSEEQRGVLLIKLQESRHKQLNLEKIVTELSKERRENTDNKEIQMMRDKLEELMNEKLEMEENMGVGQGRQDLIQIKEELREIRSLLGGSVNLQKSPVDQNVVTNTQLLFKPSSSQNTPLSLLKTQKIPRNMLEARDKLRFVENDFPILDEQFPRRFVNDALEWIKNYMEDWEHSEEGRQLSKETTRAILINKNQKHRSLIDELVEEADTAQDLVTSLGGHFDRTSNTLIDEELFLADVDMTSEMVHTGNYRAYLDKLRERRQQFLPYQSQAQAERLLLKTFCKNIQPREIASFITEMYLRQGRAVNEESGKELR